MNDPHGLVFADGRYHLYFQYVPRDVNWHVDLDWGHAVSDDLVHWTHLGSALTTPPGMTGCWSGSLVLADRPTMLFTNPSADDWGRGQVVLAFGSDDLRTWEPGPVVIDGPPTAEFRDFRDPQVRRVGDAWAMTIGAGMQDGTGGVALQYTSDDLQTWRFDGVLATAPFDPTADVNTGDVWECPQFLHVDGHWVLLLSAMEAGQKYARQIYAIGSYDGTRFTPETWGDFGHGEIAYAATTFTDAVGRPGLMAWFRERSEELPEPSPWTGAQSVVHELRVVDGRLHAPFHPNLDDVCPPLFVVGQRAADFLASQRFRIQAPSTIELRDSRHVIALHFDGATVRVSVDEQLVLDAKCPHPRAVDLLIDAEWLEFVCDGVEGMYVAKVPALNSGMITAR